MKPHKWKGRPKHQRRAGMIRAVLASKVGTGVTRKPKRSAVPTIVLGGFRIPAMVVTLFERFALQVAAAGHRRYSAQGVLERIRWHSLVEKVGQFKCNNNWAAPLARWFNAKHPELRDFFKTRQRGKEATP